MSEFMRASVARVEDLFQDERTIQLPWFQRAYAWREENVQRLISDVRTAMRSQKKRYSLGNIYLAGPPDTDCIALVDGHQRAITLAMMFAVLRDIIAVDETIEPGVREQMTHRLHALLQLQPDSPGNTASWRLATKPQMAEFFARTVLDPGATAQKSTDDMAELTPAQRNLINNRDRMRTELGPGEMSGSERLAFVDYLLTRCHMVVIEIDDEDEAWSMLGIEQITRLPHDVSEQAKITIIYSMKAAEQEEAAQIWESVQAQIGTERVSELLGHLRTQRIERRSPKPLEGELQQLYALNSDGLEFMRTIFRQNADAMRRIETRAIGAGVVAGIIHRHLEVLSWLEHRQWVAPVLAWLTSKGDLHRETELFFAKLERLAWMLRLASTDPNEQENRFIALTNAVRRPTSVDEWPEFEIGRKTLNDALVILRSRTFYFKHASKNVLRRLSLDMGTDTGAIDGEQVTVEHILPRNPPAGRQWFVDFGSMANVRAHADRLGNLAILSGKDNREADTNDWPIKRKIYERCVPPERKRMELALDAAQFTKWTPDIILTRTERLIERLFHHWQITVTPP